MWYLLLQVHIIRMESTFYGQTYSNQMEFNNTWKSKFCGTDTLSRLPISENGEEEKQQELQEILEMDEELEILSNLYDIELDEFDKQQRLDSFLIVAHFPKSTNGNNKVIIFTDYDPQLPDSTTRNIKAILAKYDPPQTISSYSKQLQENIKTAFRLTSSNLVCRQANYVSPERLPNYFSVGEKVLFNLPNMLENILLSKSTGLVLLKFLRE